MPSEHLPPRRPFVRPYATDPSESSNAANYAAPVGYQVNPRTGALQVSIAPPTLFGFLGAAATPAIHCSQEAGFLDKQILHLPLGWLHSYSFILESKIYINAQSSFFIDPNYPTGMRYYTLKDATYADVGGPQPFPHDITRSYTSVLRLATGDRHYFDAYGRLLGMDDRFGNHVVFEYEGDGDVVASRIARIIDSFGQATVFTYATGRITVTYPRGGPNTVEFSFLLDEENYLVGYIDPLGQQTTIESRGGLARHDLVSRIAYPNGLDVRYDYGALRFYDAAGRFHRVDCVVGVRATSANVTRSVTYDYDPNGTAHNYTGYPIYRVGSDKDNLLESSDNEYRYRTRIDDGVLLTEHVYNRLHLELETRSMTKSMQSLVSHVVKTYPGEGADQSFPLYVDLRRDFPNYQSPVRVLSETYNTTGQKRQHVVETDFDLYGHPEEVRSYRSDSLPLPDALLWKQRTTYDYPTESDPGHYALVLAQERWDYTQALSAAGIVVRRTVNTLTEDHKSVKTTATAFVTSGTFAPNKHRRLEYDARGRVTFEEISWIDGRPHTPQKSQRSTSYQDQVPTITVTVKNVLNQSTTTIIDSTTGWTTSVTDAAGSSVSFKYDNVGRPLSQTDPLGVVTRWSYDDRTGKVTARYANGYETYAYRSGFGDEIATADNGLSGGSERTLSSNGYNALGQLVWQRGILGDASRLLYVYDDHGRLHTITDPLGNETKHEYDAAAQRETTWFNGYKVGQSSSLDGTSTSYAYSTREGDDCIETTAIADGFDQVALNRLGTTQSGMFAETSYAYGPGLNLDSYAVRGADGITGQHGIERDLFGNVREESVVVRTASRGLPAAKSDIAQHNELDQLVEDTNQVGQRSVYTYDSVGRQATFTDYSGTVFRSQYRPNNQIQFVSHEDEAGKPVVKRFGYDPLTHELTSIEESIDGQSKGAIGRSYLLDGSLEDVTYPDGKKVSISYEARYARVDRVTDALGNTTKYGYDEWGRLKSAEIAELGHRVAFDYYSRSEDAANSGRLKSTTTNGGLRRTFHYDGFGSVAKIVYSDIRPGIPRELFSTELTYAMPTRNLAAAVSRSSLRPDDPVLNRRVEYTYNSLDQLTREKVATLADATATTVDYEYDAANNVIREVRTDASGATRTIAYLYDADNKLLQVTGPDGSASLSYDTNGNLTSDGRGATYFYDKKGKLTRYVQQHRGVECGYAYYPNELRATRQAGRGDPIRYYYDGASVPSIVNEVQAGADASYLLAGNERTLRLVREPGNTSQQFLLSGSKDVSAVVDSNLALDSAYSYDPYGAQPPSGAPISGVKANPFQYTRQYTDLDSELVYLRSRYYHPGLKRFLTRDTANLLNRYNYGDANPINGTDPTGEIFGIDDFLIGLALSAVIGTAIGAATGAFFGALNGDAGKGAKYGALAGLVGGAAAFAIGTAITGGIAAAGAYFGFAVEEAGSAVGALIGAGTGAASEAAGGVLGQLAANAAAGDDLGEGLGKAALTGALFGGLIGGATGWKATFKYTNGNVGDPQGMQQFGLDFKAAMKSERPSLIESVSPRRLKNLAHDTKTWKRIGRTIRDPGGEHEWLVVQHTARWRAFGYTVEQIRSKPYRTPTNELGLDISGTGTWKMHNKSGGHPFINIRLGKTTGVLNLHGTIRDLADRVRVSNGAGGYTYGIHALPSAFQLFVPPIARLIRMPFSIAYGVQGRVWF